VRSPQRGFLAAGGSWAPAGVTSPTSIRSTIERDNLGTKPTT